MQAAENVQPGVGKLCVYWDMAIGPRDGVQSLPTVPTLFPAVLPTSYPTHFP
jgi:hypothetical protein